MPSSDGTPVRPLCLRCEFRSGECSTRASAVWEDRWLMFRNPADILNYGGIKCYPVYWVRTRGRVVAGSKYYLNKNKNKNHGRIQHLKDSLGIISQ